MEVSREQWGAGWVRGRMLRGEAEYALDEKGRVVIPPKFRPALGERVIVTRWIDPCLSVFPPDAWQSLEEKIRNRPVRNMEFVRMVWAAEECELDRQGRIFIPPHFREYAGIARAVTIIGMGTRLELWSTPVWRSRMKKIAKAPEALREHLEDLTL